MAIRYPEEHKKKTVKAWLQQPVGTSQLEFCEGVGISTQAFRSWRELYEKQARDELKAASSSTPAPAPNGNGNGKHHGPVLVPASQSSLEKRIAELEEENAELRSMLKKRL